MSSLVNHICFICSEEYALPTRVAINSLKRNLDKSSNKTYVCNVLTFWLSDSSISLLTDLSEPDFEIRVKIINKRNYKINNIKQITHVDKNSLLKFEIPNIFPNCNKVLYLDSDIVVKRDISEIFEIDISEYYVAGVVEYWEIYDNIRYEFDKNINNENISNDYCFNAGLMLLNTAKMREDNITEKLWAHKLKSKSWLMDQESLNKVIGNNFYKLPIRYNFNPMFLAPFNVDYINQIYGTEYTSIDDLVKDVSIIHYVAYSAKPWLGFNVAMCDEWLHEYKLLDGDINDLKREKIPLYKIPEFCKLMYDIKTRKRHLLILIPYLSCIKRNWSYYKLLIKNH